MSIGGCEICGAQLVYGKHATDHEHLTGMVRGLLCPRCNSGLGMMRDSPKLLRQAADYLERSHERCHIPTCGACGAPATTLFLEFEGIVEPQARCPRCSDPSPWPAHYPVTLFAGDGLLVDSDHHDRKMAHLERKRGDVVMRVCKWMSTWLDQGVPPWWSR